MRRIAALALSLWAVSAHPDIVGWVGIPLELDETTAAVSNVIGQASTAAAEAILIGDGFVLGTVNTRCSASPLNQIVGQSPTPGQLAPLGSAVDLLASNGTACPRAGRPGVRLRGLRMPGL